MNPLETKLNLKTSKIMYRTLKMFKRLFMVNRKYIKVYITRKLIRLCIRKYYKSLPRNNLMTSRLLEILKMTDFFF